MDAAPRALRALTYTLAVLAVVLGTLAVSPVAEAARKAPGPSPAPAAPRAMWVWTQPSARTLVDFATAHKVTELFLSVPSHLPGNATALSWATSVRDLAVPAGIKVAALGGDPFWVDDPAAAVAWQTEALSTGLFSGSHVDLEPWLHPQWSTDQAGVVRRYLDVLTQLNAATSLPLEADVSFWLWTITTDAGTTLDRAALGAVDRITIMSYRDTVTGADSITDVGARTLAAAAAAGKKARLAVETNYLGSDAVSQKQTFYGVSQTQLESALAGVDTAEAGSSAYAGIAVEDYTGWAALRR